MSLGLARAAATSPCQSEFIDITKILTREVRSLTTALLHRHTYKMADYDSDSSGIEDIETGVTLGYASNEATGDDFSQIGGYPVRHLPQQYLNQID